MYKTKVGSLPDILASVKNNKLNDPIGAIKQSGRIILKGGTVVDPKNNIQDVKDISILNGRINQVENDIKPESGDKVINCEGLLVVPGLIDMHLHLGDLFEVSTAPVFEAVQCGVTMGLSPGAGNTFMAPALLGAEVDRGLPLNLGVYLGALNVLGTRLSVEEIIKLFKGELEVDIATQKMTRNMITYMTAPLTVGIKDHMGHFIMPDESFEKVYEITSKANLIFMSHTQDPAHAERVVELSKGRNVHLAHATAAGCGTHMDAVEGMKAVIELIERENVSGEFVTTMLRKGLGSREGLQMPKQAQQVALDALEAGIVDVLISDGQNEATMKGFGDTRDNIPALIELAEQGVLSLSDSIATMTCNPAKLIADRTKNDWWVNEVGHLGVGALANVTIIDKDDKLATYTIVNGNVVSFENRAVRRGNGAGGWISRFGMVRNVGTGDITTHSYQK
ncbi:amidohydrolase family protein [Brassicibacter mesophilus]|uniref:amidohydrolase family protein n=1 Tax=Brassicibacter mesophilus TaxID=745119 RepID=UPI003D215E3A